MWSTGLNVLSAVVKTYQYMTNFMLTPLPAWSRMQSVAYSCGSLTLLFNPFTDCLFPPLSSICRITHSPCLGRQTLHAVALCPFALCTVAFVGSPWLAVALHAVDLHASMFCASFFRAIVLGSVVLCVAAVVGEMSTILSGPIWEDISPLYDSNTNRLVAYILIHLQSKYILYPAYKGCGALKILSWWPL